MTRKLAPLVPEGIFQPTGLYFDSPTYGLAPKATFDAVVGAARRWHEGTATMSEYDEAVSRSRDLFARIVGADLRRVAVGANVSSLVGPVAAGLPADSKILVPEDEFTSLIFPLLVSRGSDVRSVPLAELASSVDETIDVVAFSLVQSSTGEVADVDSIVDACRRHGAITMVDATHAAGWLPFDPSPLDFVFVAAYKWLLCPRGVAFLIVNSALETPPLNAGWYSGEDPWESIYGEPLRLADSARRFDTSPAWIAWVGAVPSLELIDSLGVDRIHSHDVALANQIRAGLGIETSNSAIVTLPAARPDRLAEAGIKAAVRASAVRVGCHIHNSSAQVDLLIAVLSEAQNQ